MAELAEADAFEGLGLPLVVGETRLAALPPVQRMLVAPFAGVRMEGLPAPGRVAETDGGRIVWAGMGQWLVEGGAPVPEGAAARTDQTDGWAAMSLTGLGAAEVLARLVPLDLDARVFPPGSVARSLLRHVMLLLIAADDGFDLLVPRSYARTTARELGEAMRAVAGRAALTPGRGEL